MEPSKTRWLEKKTEWCGGAGCFFFFLGGGMFPLVVCVFLFFFGCVCVFFVRVLSFFFVLDRRLGLCVCRFGVREQTCSCSLALREINRTPPQNHFENILNIDPPKKQRPPPPTKKTSTQKHRFPQRKTAQSVEPPYF